MTYIWMLLLGIEVFSLVAMLLGIVLYRYVLAGNRVFLRTLQHTEKQERKEHMGFLGWFYVILTLSLLATFLVVLSQNALLLPL
ncbi:MAG: hypothetical protein KBA40_03080 [Candidatus Peribacteraceae bacterium]|nr:hypothetical protein [Candidatus Peribacteraceae bacterium]MBP9850521.1 hypothetical protein [Candidatus Peribacteraceae bacterium]